MKKVYRKIILADIFGNPYETEYDTIGGARVHGYENAGGSWALSKISEDWVPCTFVEIKFKRQRKFRTISRSRIIHCPPMGIYQEATDE